MTCQHLCFLRGNQQSHHPLSASTHSKKLDSFVVLEALSGTEVRWTLKNTFFSIFSFCSCDGISALFKMMFPDSSIAQKIFLQKDKCSYYINYSIAPHFWSILASNVMILEFYTIYKPFLLFVKCFPLLKKKN